MDNRKLARAALLLALTVIFQSLRLIMPMPPLFTTFIIGSLVNLCLILAVLEAGLTAAVVIAVVAPVVAMWQGVLPLPIFVIPVAIGNVVYVAIYQVMHKLTWLTAVSVAAVAKTVVLFIGFYYLALTVVMPLAMIKNLMFVMSWPQLVTGLVGAGGAIYIYKRLNNHR